ncbi:adenylyl-sulfate reductase subunit alpha [Asaccharospora irregularis]|uniref:Dissimilatory adenylylsulfate reductase alpha subunit n=1 Tax=Asaccharospora irregularis DSM 2635 TaxID=1121321 RepID=A0A1M5KAU1_9FIRM|nr:adenylyl-sulfate reductase subunit alpha [Asaccharospora irregularis]SHG49966.1 dissimilatory adenylylsulfate reductase alpha subunit precursor [Asaccharospora irregularis DSM 2635]
MKLKPEVLETDILIIGGGAAGCFAALTASEKSEVQVIIAEKANIKRSGCLAAGVNALNAYITEGETPQSFVDYVKDEFNGVIREDLVYTIAEKLNSVTKKIEDAGLPILKDENGDYVSRGKRSIKINGENIKPLLASEVSKKENIRVMNGLNITDYILKNNKVIGAYGFSIDEEKFYVIYSKAVICTTGGAAGIYKPNNPTFSKHKMWYSPFNTGAGYAMGIRAGAEMTTFEMRFIALRCKDTIAPTGTIAQGVRTPQVNSLGERYVKNYGKATTINRLYSTVMENLNGRGPCFLKTKDINGEQENELFKAYLNMAPAQTLKWVDSNTSPSTENVEIEGTEPYIVGGHTASGYWIDIDRKTTLEGLYAAGDVAGGSPKKYVTGCFAEGEIAANHAISYIENKTNEKIDELEIQSELSEINGFFQNEGTIYTIDQVEEVMQKTMDEYAGGISQGYSYTKIKLKTALNRIDELIQISKKLKANDCHELLFIYEIIDRLYVAKVLIAHLMARAETRWRCYQENADFPEKDDNNWMKYVNSIYKDGNVQILLRDLIERREIS